MLSILSMVDKESSTGIGEIRHSKSRFLGIVKANGPP